MYALYLTFLLWKIATHLFCTHFCDFLRESKLPTTASLSVSLSPVMICCFLTGEASGTCDSLVYNN